MMFWKPFTPEQEEEIVKAISDAERNTSAEIRVHADRFCKGDPMNKAANIFFKLKMHKTEERNGVLVYVSVEDKRFAIIGDEGIDKKVPENFWNTTRDKMVSHFAQNRLSQGIITGIQEAGNQLMKYFPADDKGNQLPNEISYG